MSPRSFAGGVVGVEMAQAWQTLGSGVTGVEGERRLLPREEQFACEQVTAALRELGADVRCGQRVRRVQRVDNRVTVWTEDGATAEAVEGVAALGRRPATTGLGLEALGIAADGPAPVDDHMRVVDLPWLYANRRRQRPSVPYAHRQGILRRKWERSSTTTDRSVRAPDRRPLNARAGAAFRSAGLRGRDAY